MKRAAILALALVVAGCSLQKKQPSIAVGAHATGAIIGGTVVDPSKTPLPGVTVTLTDPSGRQFTVVTDAHGRYRFVAAAPGMHTLHAELAGMTSIVRRINATAKDPLNVVIQMRLTSVAETITVAAEAPPAPPGSYTYPTRIDFVPSSRPAIDDGFDIEPRPAPVREHAFVAAQKQPVTTFSIDVDRASYAMVRFSLSQNMLPPADAVRIEELINYFPYRLPQPTGAKPFSITTEVAGCPWNPANRLLRIAIQGRNLEEWQAAPNNLVFLIDVSGSMAPPERLPLIKSAMRVLVERLRAEDSVAIVTYAGSEGVALRRTSGADKETILAALDGLESGGFTAGGAGIELAYRIAQENFLEHGNNRVILATDGDFNVGISTLPALEKLIEQKRKSGIHLTTLGVGTGNYRDAVLELLADKGNGNYAYLDSIQEAEKVFRRELTGTLVAIAKDVKVQLDFDPSAVESYRQIGYENRALENEDFEDDAKDAGELGAGHTVTALYEFVPRGNTGGRTIATVKLRYKLPTSNASQPVHAVARDDGKTAYDASPDMQFAAAVAQLGMLLRNSPHRGNATYADVLHLARLAQGEDLDGLREEFIRLADSARSLSGGQ